MNTKSHYILHSHGFSGIDENVTTWVYMGQITLLKLEHPNPVLAN